MDDAPSKWTLAGAGILAGLSGLVMSQATVWALGGGESPLIAVALAVRDFTPGTIAIHLVEKVKHLDKPLLVAGTSVVTLIVCAVAGIVSRRRPLAATLIFLALAIVGVLALLRLDGNHVLGGFATVVGLITWIVVLRFLTGPLLDGPVSPSAERSSLVAQSRRSFLGRAALVGAGVVVVGGGGRLLGRGRRRVEQSRRLLRLPVTRGRAPEQASLGVDGISPWRTPNPAFYQIDTALSPPAIAPKDWSLRIHGMVDTPRTYDYQDLVDRQLTEDWITICCVSNPVGGDLIGNAWWSGVLIRTLLAEVGPHDGADAVLQTSDDGWSCATPLTALTDNRNAMLAIAMNGHPLPVRHGFPVRMIVPGLYGYVSATKWVVDLEVTRFDEVDAYWTQRGWSEQGPVKTQSRIDVPRGGSRVSAGTVRIGGTAWAQHTGIERVEFQLDGSSWQKAELGVVPGIDTWVQWAGTVEVEPGRHVLAVRATDRSGYTQTSVRADVLPDGATGWHTIDFEAS